MSADKIINGKYQANIPKHITRMLIVMVFVAFCAVGAFWFVHNPGPSIPDSIRNQAGFALYFPNPLPEGFVSGNDSHSYSQGVLISKISAPLGNSVIITQQSKPEKLQLNEFFKEQVSGTEQIELPIGRGLIGRHERSNLAVITAQQTLIIINGQGLNQDELKSLATRLKPVR